MSALTRSGREVRDPLKPTSAMGIYLSTHEHDWLEIGAKRMPIGTWHPVFRCEVCGDVIYDQELYVGPNPAEGFAALDALREHDQRTLRESKKAKS